MLATGRRPWDRADCARMLGWTTLALMAVSVCPDGACPGAGPGSPALGRLTRFGRGTSSSSAAPEQGRVGDGVQNVEGGGPARIPRFLGGLHSWTSGIAPQWEGRRLLLRGGEEEGLRGGGDQEEGMGREPEGTGAKKYNLRDREMLRATKHVRPPLFFTLVTGPTTRRSLSLKLSDTRVYEPQIRARLGTTTNFCRVVVLKLPRRLTNQ